MGRFYKTAKPVFLSDGAYRAPLELMRYGIEKDNTLRNQVLQQVEQARILALQQPYYNDPDGIERNKIESIQNYYDNKINDIVNGINESTDYSGLKQAQANVSRELMEDLKIGELSKIASRYNAYQSLMNDYKEKSKSDSTSSNAVLKWELDNLNNAVKQNNNYNPNSIITKPDIQAEVDKRLQKVKVDKFITLDNGYIVSTEQLTPEEIHQHVVQSVISDPNYQSYMQQGLRIGMFDENSINPYVYVDGTGTPVNNETLPLREKRYKHLESMLGDPNISQQEKQSITNEMKLIATEKAVINPNWYFHNDVVKNDIYAYKQQDAKVDQYSLEKVKQQNRAAIIAQQAMYQQQLENNRQANRLMLEQQRQQNRLQLEQQKQENKLQLKNTKGNKNKTNYYHTDEEAHTTRVTYKYDEFLDEDNGLNIVQSSLGKNEYLESDKTRQALYQKIAKENLIEMFDGENEMDLPEQSNIPTNSKKLINDLYIIQKRIELDIKKKIQNKSYLTNKDLDDIIYNTIKKDERVISSILDNNTLKENKYLTKKEYLTLRAHNIKNYTEKFTKELYNHYKKIKDNILIASYKDSYGVIDETYINDLYINDKQSRQLSDIIRSSNSTTNTFDIYSNGVKIKNDKVINDINNRLIEEGSDNISYGFENGITPILLYTDDDNNEYVIKPGNSQTENELNSWLNKNNLTQKNAQSLYQLQNLRNEINAKLRLMSNGESSNIVPQLNSLIDSNKGYVSVYKDDNNEGILTLWMKNKNNEYEKLNQYPITVDGISALASHIKQSGITK